MITPSHIIYGWAIAKATKSTPDKKRTLSFVFGSVLPDVPVYVFFFVQTFLLGTSQQLLWDELYFDSAWTPIITLSHSLLLWPLLLLVATLSKQVVLRYIATAGLLHVIIDFFVHHDDAYRHFWPLSEWKFLSPLSYYDPQYFGHWVNTFDTVLILVLLAWLGCKYPRNWRAHLAICTIIILYTIVYAFTFFKTVPYA